VNADATTPSTTKPVVLYACIHNSGRSVAAQVLTEHYARGAVAVRSAGSEPGNAVNPVIAAVLAERGLSTADHTPTLLDYDLVQTADVVVTMGCGETCPVFPGKRYEDWPVADPKDQDLPTVRAIVDDIDRRVRGLLTGLGLPTGPGLLTGLGVATPDKSAAGA
jgi:arsenate reductase (thioredoxin)